MRNPLRGRGARTDDHRERQRTRPELPHRTVRTEPRPIA